MRYFTNLLADLSKINSLRLHFGAIMSFAKINIVIYILLTGVSEVLPALSTVFLLLGKNRLRRSTCNALSPAGAS
jgi:hypothetical protein